MLPRFSVSVDMNLKAFLQKMGIRDLFDPSVANLTGITDDVQLSFTEVFHKSYLNVYENGTEASAASASVAVATSADLPSAVTFNANHPFTFLIRENPTGTILFAGRYMGPDQNEGRFGVFAENLASEPVMRTSLSNSGIVVSSNVRLLSSLIYLFMFVVLLS